MNSIIPHQFKGKPIQQLAKDTLINGTLVPKGFVNATQICQANGKRWVKYMEFSKTPAFLEALIGVSPSEGLTPIITITEGSNEYRGTWVCLPVAMNLAQWCSPAFAAWASIVLSHIVEGNYEALNKEAEVAQAKLQEQWQEIRDGAKQAFWDLGDAIKSYKEANPEKSDNYRAFIYSNCQDAINRGLFGKCASKIRDELKVPDLLRDHFGQTALKRIELVQSLASASIVHRDIEPLEAVKSALAMYSFDVTNYKE